MHGLELDYMQEFNSRIIMANAVISGPKVTAKIDNKSLGELFFENAHKYARNICQINGETGEKETFGSVIQRSTRLALHMKDLGVQSKDIVALCMSNTVNNCIPAIAGLLIGATIANLDPLLSSRDCTHLLKLVSPKIIFVDQSATALIEQSLEDITKTKIIVNGISDKYSILEQLTQPHEKETIFKPEIVDPKSTAFVLFSSGTTGLPKGIKISHYGMINSALVQALECYINPKVMLHVTSLYWITACIILTICFLKGTTKISIPNLIPEKFFEMIEEHKISHTFLSPSITYKLKTVKDFKKYDTSSLYTITAGGSPISSKQIMLMKDMFPNCFVSLGYGMTEAGGFLTNFDYKRDIREYKEKITSTGKPVPGCEMKIVDPDTDQDLGRNQKGEIRYKLPFMMSGYYKMDPSVGFDKDGFFKTGDVGYCDDDDCIYVIDRIKEMFKFRSWHVVPTSVEALLAEHPAVKESIVFGIPKEGDDEIPAAVVILHEGCTATPDEIEAFVEAKAADHQKLRGGVFIAEEFPRTPSGKVKRKDVKELFSKFLGKKPYV